MNKKYPFILIITIFMTNFCQKSKDDKKLLVFGLLYFNSQNVSVFNPSATRVYGQNGSFTTNTQNNGGLSASSLYRPFSLVLDSSDGIYVADTFNGRILYFPKSSVIATRVYGQSGNFSSATPVNSVVTANSLDSPAGVILDSSGGLYISDNSNSRILYFSTGSTTATRVYGQNGSFTTNTQNNGGRSANSLQFPFLGLALDSSNGLYVSDSFNNRVLYYPSGTTTATRVYGQNGSFTAKQSNLITNADSLYSPSGLSIDKNDGLYVADSSNNRVLYYPSGTTTATRVYGQNGSFTSRNLPNSDETTANNLASPNNCLADANGGLYIADYNNRVLYYPPGSTTATRVYGQNGSMSSGIENNGGVTASSLNLPSGLALDSSGRLYITDSKNNRVLYY